MEECTVGLHSPGGGQISVEMLMAVTNREIEAGRMAEDHSMRKIAVDGVAAPHFSHAEMVAQDAMKVAAHEQAKVASPAAPSAPGQCPGGLRRRRDAW